MDFEPRLDVQRFGQAQRSEETEFFAGVAVKKPTDFKLPPSWPYYFEFKVTLKAVSQSDARMGIGSEMVPFQALRGEELGLEFEVDQGVLPKVVKVSKGRITRWNMQTTADQQVRVGDFLVQIDPWASGDESGRDERIRQ